MTYEDTYLLPKNRLDVSHYLKRVPGETKKKHYGRENLLTTSKSRSCRPVSQSICTQKKSQRTWYAGYFINKWAGEKEWTLIGRKMEYEDTYLPKTRKDGSNYLEPCTWATWIDICKCTGKNRKLFKEAQRWGHVERWHIPPAKNQTRKSVDTRTWGTGTKKRKKREREKKTKLTHCHKSKSSTGSVFPDDMHQETPKRLASCHKNVSIGTLGNV